MGWVMWGMGIILVASFLADKFYVDRTDEIENARLHHFGDSRVVPEGVRDRVHIPFLSHRIQVVLNRAQLWHLAKRYGIFIAILFFIEACRRGLHP